MRFFSTISTLASTLASVSATTNSSSAITTKKISPSYWRATFSNPPFNVQTNAWFTDLYNLIDDIEKDPNVQVVVFDSCVPNFWVAHLDVVGTIDQGVIDAYFGNLTRLANLPVVTVAAIQGIARGGGAEFATSLDVRFASKEKAVFSQFEVGTGGIPGGGGLSFLPRLVGRGRTMEIVLGADDLDAETAALYGWINRAILDSNFEGFVDKFAQRVAGWDHAAIAAAKKIINDRTGYPTAEEQQSDFATFGQLASQPNVAKRYGALAAAGFESEESFEVNLTTELLKFTGEGPWNT